ncbi:hypothetical protein KGF56_000059 [Candida oxycetoniae]|uniref:Major facilitator superfamily (MFS) profile domain-containing protein n=1 Tax=Candida oxycetoniae TaxID=497107 RepID=A0AAI9T292_9ASCO|nr:uncharacterized protein KGF56_000059 [Candida oxycetoniae]KAI3407157.2 hypothetical protein KGF56_000059 [Candida oxycetoniae]
MKLLCLIWISGIIFTFVSESVSMLIVGKAIKGMAIGVAFATVPTYLYEIIPLRRRARMLTLFTFFCALGNLFMFLLPIVLSHSLQGEHYLNFHWLVELIPVTFLTIAVLFIPESPKWLASSDKWTRAADILECIEWKNSGNLERRKTRNERVKLGDKHFVVKKYSTTVEIKSCNINALFGRKYIKEITVGILLQLLVDFMGVSKLAESLNYICSACQITSLEELRMVQTFVLVVRCLFMIIPILVLDSMKRRDVLVFGVSIVSIVMVSYMIMFLAFSVRRPARSAYLNVDWVLKVEFFKERASLVLALTVFMDVLHYALILPSSWLLILETFSTSSRTRGWVFISSLHWLFACSTSLVFPFLLSHLNGWLFFIFSLVCMAAVAMSFTIQETREIMLLDSSQIVFETARNKMGKTSTLIDTKTDSD